MPIVNYSFLHTHSFQTLQDGIILLVDKPLGWTSFQAVKHLKYQILRHYNQKKIKIGHCGTLDPLASGLLIICVGKATKQVPIIQNQSKYYTAHIHLGATTPSFDLETDVDKTFATEHISLKKIQHIIDEKFIGITHQIPPIFSAKKIGGKRAYEFARKQQEVVMNPKEVNITSIAIEDYEPPHKLCLSINCSKGTYIRSLARDLGEALDSGAHLIGLKRTAIGNYQLEDSFSLISNKTQHNICT